MLTGIQTHTHERHLRVSSLVNTQPHTPTNKLADEDCYSQANDPYSVTCYADNDFVYAPCSDLFIPSTPTRPNNFTYFAICTFPDYYEYDEADFWSEIITVEVCQNYWDACISDNPLAKYDDTIEYGKDECRKVTDKACGSDRNNEFTIPGSEPEDTTLGAFDFGPYSTVSQVTVPRVSMAETGSVSRVSAASTSRIVVGSTTAASQTSASRTSSASLTHISSSTSASSTTIAQVTTTSKAGRRTKSCSLTTAACLAGLFLPILVSI